MEAGKPGRGGASCIRSLRAFPDQGTEVYAMKELNFNPPRTPVAAAGIPFAVIQQTVIFRVGTKE